MPTDWLYYGDNLDILRHKVPSASVDLVYLDPPFNSNADYNVIFREQTGEKSAVQIKAFTDTWHWDAAAERAREEILTSAPDNVARMLDAVVSFIGRNDLTAYLVMMTQRLIELHRVLTPIGSLYLHCDPTASHFLKIVLDAIFGPQHFRNEIIWRRTSAHGKVRRYAPIHDTILFYTKSGEYKWYHPMRPYMKGHVQEYFAQDEKGWRTDYYGNVLTGSGLRNGESGMPWRGFDPSAKGRHWAIPGALLEDVDGDFSGMTQHQKLERLYELGLIKIVPGQAWPIYERRLKPADGTPVADIWAFQPYTQGTVFGTDAGIDEDVRWLSPKDRERLGYQTQKPLSLLERIITASSNPGDVVLDPFCGCGTAICAAQKLGRHWIGIDITHLAVSLMKSRLKSMFGLDPNKDYKVWGEPTDVAGARQLALDDRYQFQYWAVSLIEATAQEQKKGADKGIDGIIPFIDGANRHREKIIVQVKSGHVTSSHIRDLKGVLDREKAAMGLYICLEPPTKDMRDEANSAGFYRSQMWSGRRGDHKWPRIQIRTIAELLAGNSFELPPRPVQFKQAERVERTASDQGLATPAIWTIGSAPAEDASDEPPDYDDADEIG